MIQMLKKAAIALVALATLGFAAASPAAAMEGEEFFHSHIGKNGAEPDSVIITAEQVAGEEGQQVFTFKPGGASFACSVVRLRGTQEGITHTNGSGVTTLTSESVTVHPEYEGSGPAHKCNFGGGTENLEVRTNECHYKLTATTPEATPNSGAPLHIECPEGQSIETKATVSGVTATIKIGPQTPGGGLTYTTVGETANSHLTAKQSLTGISYTCSPSLACNLAGIGTSGSSGTWTGSVTVKGFEDREKTSTGTYVEGEQVGIFRGPTK